MNNRNLWKTIKKIIPNKSMNVPNLISGQDILSSNDTANKFNSYFTSIGEQLGIKFNVNGNTECPCNNVCSIQNNVVNKFHFQEITPEFVLKQINNIKNNKSPELDQVNVKLLKLKLAAPFISECLASICNLSLSKSHFPDDWKKAKVTPILSQVTKPMLVTIGRSQF